MRGEAGKLPDDVVDSLVTALLAVNNYSLEKVWQVLPRLQNEGLTNPGLVASEVRGTASSLDGGYRVGRTRRFGPRCYPEGSPSYAGHVQSTWNWAGGRSERVVAPPGRG